jgi:hypothetical protein
MTFAPTVAPIATAAEWRASTATYARGRQPILALPQAILPFGGRSGPDDETATKSDRSQRLESGLKRLGPSGRGLGGGIKGLTRAELLNRAADRT